MKFERASMNDINVIRGHNGLLGIYAKVWRNDTLQKVGLDEKLKADKSRFWQTMTVNWEGEVPKYD